MRSSRYAHGEDGDDGACGQRDGDLRPDAARLTVPERRGRDDAEQLDRRPCRAAGDQTREGDRDGSQVAAEPEPAREQSGRHGDDDGRPARPPCPQSWSAVRLLVDTASASRRLDPDTFARWAATRTVFLSSEMRALGALRRDVASALRAAGFSVVVFEDLGGRDEDAEQAYLDGVARSDIYVGVIADRYGTMLASGRSPTHEEYLEARRRGKRISFWLQRDASQRQGHAADFAQEVQAFHTTGQFVDAQDLATRLLQRLAEIAADDEAPWIKIADVCMRASSIRDEGSTIVVSAEVRDQEVVYALEQMRPDQFNRGQGRPIATGRSAGEARVTGVVIGTQASSVHEIELTAEVTWADGRGGSMEASFNGLSPDDQTEIGLRTGLLGEPLPGQLASSFGFMIDSSDPLAGLEAVSLPPAAEEAVGRLLIVERLLGGNRASRVTHFALGPAHLGQRRVELEWVEPQRYVNHEPGTRRIEGVRRS